MHGAHIVLDDGRSDADASTCQRRPPPVRQLPGCEEFRHPAAEDVGQQASDSFMCPVVARAVLDRPDSSSTQTSELGELSDRQIVLLAQTLYWMQVHQRPLFEGAILIVSLLL